MPTIFENILNCCISLLFSFMCKHWPSDDISYCIDVRDWCLEVIVNLYHSTFI